MNNTTLELRVRPGTGSEDRERVLYRWYRDLLRQHMPELVSEWEPRIGVSVAIWGIRRMKTKWGSCNPDARRIWLNSELAKRPLACLEYVLVHELVHLRNATTANGSRRCWSRCCRPGDFAATS